jgi:hypothetical protein
MSENSKYLYMKSMGKVVAQWLRHCATNRKVTGSIELVCANDDVHVSDCGGK